MQFGLMAVSLLAGTMSTVLWYRHHDDMPGKLRAVADDLYAKANELNREWKTIRLEADFRIRSAATTYNDFSPDDVVDRLCAYRCGNAHTAHQAIMKDISHAVNEGHKHHQAAVDAILLRAGRFMFFSGIRHFDRSVADACNIGVDDSFEDLITAEIRRNNTVDHLSAAFREEGYKSARIMEMCTDCYYGEFRA